MIKLTTPEGTIYIRKSAIIAACATKRAGQNETSVKSLVWVEGQEDAFNIIEDVETFYGLLS